MYWYIDNVIISPYFKCSFQFVHPDNPECIHLVEPGGSIHQGIHRFCGLVLGLVRYSIYAGVDSAHPVVECRRVREKVVKVLLERSGRRPGHQRGLRCMQQTGYRAFLQISGRRGKLRAQKRPRGQMISDDQLNSITLTFGFASIVLILVYHAILTNINAYRS